MRFVFVLGLLVLPLAPAFAQQPFSPLSGPNDAIPSPFCDLVNFGFCPQPPPPAPPFPDANEDVRAVRALPPPPAPVRHHRRHHRHPAG